jgi:hypothetical protein
MKSPPRTIRALRSALGLALVSAFALMTSAASATETGYGPGPGPEPVQSFTLDCTNGGGTILGKLNVTMLGGQPVSCSRYNTIPSGPNPTLPPPPGLAACWQLAKQFGCPGFGN